MSAAADNAERTPVIEVEDLRALRSRDILRDVNLTVYQGEILVIMGGSGSGKEHLPAATCWACTGRWAAASNCSVRTSPA